MTKMIPPIPTAAVMMPTPKQKIGFSIESIVGNDAQPSTNLQQSLGKNVSESVNSEAVDRHTAAAVAARHDIQDIISRLHHHTHSIINNNNNIGLSNNNNNNNNNNSSGNETPLSPVLLNASNLNDSLNRKSPIHHLSKSPYSSSPVSQKCLSPELDHVRESLKRARSPTSPPASLSQPQQSQMPPQNFCMNKSPMGIPGMPPGLVRPFPVQPPNMPDIKSLPPYLGSPEMVPPQHNPHLIAAAQFQMAAALQAGHVLGPAAGLGPHSPFLHNPGMPRESYPLYPWLLSRHGRIFPHRFPGNFLLQPFRKPKRIRTAFSPSQLLKLEHAFESNQYVVGAERKALAQSLNLSETQVKVWFQNRRTKHKRMQQEDEKGPGNGQPSSPSKHSNNISGDEDEDELIDMEMDDCPSDEEPEHNH